MPKCSQQHDPLLLLLAAWLVAHPFAYCLSPLPCRWRTAPGVLWASLQRTVSRLPRPGLVSVTVTPRKAARQGWWPCCCRPRSPPHRGLSLFKEGDSGSTCPSWLGALTQEGGGTQGHLCWGQLGTGEEGSERVSPSISAAWVKL